MKLFTCLSIFSLFFLLSSCDCAYNYTYEVENQSSSTIKVKWEHFSFTDPGPRDSAEIAPGTTHPLFTTIHGIEPCRTGPFYQDVDLDFTSISITRDDTVSTKLDYLENQQWFYEDGLYKAVVADSSF